MKTSRLRRIGSCPTYSAKVRGRSARSKVSGGVACGVSGSSGVRVFRVVLRSRQGYPGRRSSASEARSSASKSASGLAFNAMSTAASATAGYLAKLPPVEGGNPNKGYNRYKAEEWIGGGNPKVLDLKPGWPDYPEVDGEFNSVLGGRLHA